MEFIISRATRVAAQWNSVPVQCAIRRMRRDMEMALAPTDITQNNEIVICLAPQLPAEGYTIDIQDERTLIVCAADDLGAVYALLYLSRTCLGVDPLWFWNDQQFEPQPLAAMTEEHVDGTPAPIPLRGWALDDEPLLSVWAVQANHGWEMALEALLRCGGNTVMTTYAPCREKAEEMGLWVMQPPGSPLGAMPFSEVYPSLTPGWPAQSEAYRALWGETVRRHKGDKVVWNLEFHGRNGQPFWEDDPSCITMDQRGRRLSTILRTQYDLVRGFAPTAPCCTRLEGEEAALYRAGMLDLPEDVILLWPDNGRGRMPALPEAGCPGRHGIALHLAGWDGQGGNSLTMMPDGPELLCRELQDCRDRGATALWLLHAPGIRPHLYPLDLTAALWRDPEADPERHRTEYLRTYYRAPDGWELTDSALDDLTTCLKAWGDSTVALKDRRCGEQLMAGGVRAFGSAWLAGRVRSSVPAMRWLAGDRPFGEQLTRYREACLDALPRFETLVSGCEYAGRSTTRLWSDSILFQARFYLCCLRGAVRFCDGCAHYFNRDYLDCFLLIGQAIDDFNAAQAAMRATEHDRWADFYQNECDVDCTATLTVLRAVMAMVRAAGDGPDFTDWQRQAAPDLPRGPRLSDAALYRMLRPGAAQT